MIWDIELHTLDMDNLEMLEHRKTLYDLIRAYQGMTAVMALLCPN